MQTSKRSGDLIAFSHESKKTCSVIFTNHDVCCELSEAVESYVARSVVSLSLDSDGTCTHFVCSGTVIEHFGNFSRILTSANLIRALHDQRKKNPSVQIKVTHEGRDTKAFLEKCDLDLEIAIFRTLSSLSGLDSVHLDHSMEFLPHSKVFAAGCDGDGSGRVMFQKGALTGSSQGSEVFVSTCKFPKEYEGGALFDVDGNFLGLNLFSDVQRSIFLPSSLIRDQKRESPLRSSFVELIQQFKAVRINSGLPGEILCYHTSYKEVPNKDQLEEIVSLGYPKPPLNSNCDMILLNSFEERFGDIYPLGAWNEFGQNLRCVSQNVVALASFKGETRFFACTGCFIDWTDTCPTILTSASLVREPAGRGNNVVKDLKIQVLLPDKTLSEGTLLHCDFHYNVAVVRVKDFCPLVPPLTLNDEKEISSRLVAVGRLFKSGVLMAASGKPTCWSGGLPCKALVYFSCKITKAGIGGPLVDVAGNFIGMNFYDPKIGTPFLSHRDLRKVLEHFKKQQTVVENYQTQFGFRDCITEDRQKHRNMWPVPQPRWHSPNDRVPCYMSEKEQRILICCSPFGYFGGEIIVYK